MRMITLAAVIVTSASSGCRKPDSNTDELARVAARLDALEKRVDQVERRAPGPARRPGPDPSVVYNVPVRDGDEIRGARSAKVTIVEGFDFACPYCAMSAPIVAQVQARHPDDVRVVSRQFVVHPDVATLPALAVCAARRQGKGAELEERVWAAAWTLDPQAGPRLDRDKLARASIDQIAKELQLDASRFQADLTGADCTAELERDRRDLGAVGVNGTPAFFINGRPFQGPRTVEGFEALVAEEIRKADAALRGGGVTLDGYYASLMKSAKTSP